MEEKAKINEELLEKARKQAYQKQLATCKDSVKFMRSLLRAELETNEKLNEIIANQKQINILITHIGTPAITNYLMSMKENNEIIKGINQEQTSDIEKNNKNVVE
jgi:hypothetical protein